MHVAANSPITAAAQGEQQSQLTVKANSRLSPLRWLTGGSPTNYNMLLFRTLNREMKQPNANADDLALLLRDKLMPLRMWWVRHGPGGPAQFRKALEHKKLGAPGVVNFVDARTKWFDQVVQSALTEHNIQQVVVVAAGFDTRAYRFAGQHKGVRFFEIDLPHASRKKQQLVQELLPKHPQPTYIPADLSTVSLEHALTTGSSGFDPSVPTLFTVEGLIYYLPEVAVRQLFASVLSVAAPGSRIAFDFLHKQVLEGRVALPPAYKVTAASVANKGEPFISGIDGGGEEPVATFMASIRPATATAASSCDEGPSSTADTAAGSAVSSSSSSKRFQLEEHLTPRQMMEQQLPHLKWDDQLPPILSFYSFAALQVVG